MIALPEMTLGQNNATIHHREDQNVEEDKRSEVSLFGSRRKRFGLDDSSTQSTQMLGHRAH